MSAPSGIEYDQLTGLYSRWKCSIELQNLLNAGVYRVFGSIDLNGFKHINRLYGNKKGDELLKAIADSLRASYPSALLFRLSGDEFAFILPEMPYNKQAMCLMTRQVFTKLHEIKIEGLENEHLAFSIGSVFIDPAKYTSPDMIYFDSMSFRLEAKKHEGNYLYSDYGSIPDIEGCFIALREDRNLYNSINNRLTAIHNESDWMSYLKEGSELKENMCRRNQGHLNDILDYYKIGGLPEIEYDLLFSMIVNYVKWLDAFMLGMLVDDILIPYYESQELTDKVRSYLGHLYLLQADSLISVVRMGDKSQHNHIRVLLEKCFFITRSLPHDSIRFEPYFFALCEYVGHYESFDKINEDMEDCDKVYAELRDLLLGDDPIVFQDESVVKYFEYLINNARLFPIFRACYLKLNQRKLSEKDRKEFAARIDYIKAHLDHEGIYDMAGDNPAIRRMSWFLQSLILNNLTPQEILDKMMIALHEIHKIEYGTLSESNLIVVTYLFLGSSKILLETDLPHEEKRRIAFSGTSFLIEILRKRESIATDNQVLFMINTLMRAMLETPVLSSYEKYSFLMQAMSAVTIDTYGHSKALATYANIILVNIIDNYPQLLVGEGRPYHSIDQLSANRQELIKFMECACMLHDIGKMYITPITSNAFRKLTDKEFYLIRNHPLFGKEILGPDPAFDIYKPFIYGHHRWWNLEAGYPQKEENEIRSKFKILVDILSICDSLEAATSRIGRNYRRAKTFLQILDEFCVEAGTRYSKEVLDTIIGNTQTYYAIRQMVDQNWTQIYQHIFQEVISEDANSFNVNTENKELPDPYKYLSSQIADSVDFSLENRVSIPVWLSQMDNDTKMLFTFSMMEYNQYNVKNDQSVIFFYNVKNDVVNFTFIDPNDNFKVKHVIGQHFSVTPLNIVFSEEGYEKAISIIKRIITEPDFPKQGQQKLEYKDKNRCLLATYTSVVDNSGNVLSIIGRLEDIITTKERHLQIIQKQNEYIQILDSLCDIYVTAIRTDIEFENFEIIKGFPTLNEGAKKLKNTRDLSNFVGNIIVDPEYKDRFLEFVNPDTMLERLKGKNHLTFEYLSRFSGWLKAHIIPTDFNSKYEITHLLLITESIAEEHKKEVFLTYAANYDSLTGLMNRHHGEHIIQEEISKGGPMIFAILDCDQFKLINDQLSHLVGDKVLKGQGVILKKYFANYNCMRLGGDEFIAFINGEDASKLINSFNGISSFFNKITEELKTLRLPELENIAPTMSMGVIYAYGEKNQLTFENLYRAADTALYESKKARNGTITVNQYIQNNSMLHIF